jgi:hypothetical protein
MSFSKFQEAVDGCVVGVKTIINADHLMKIINDGSIPEYIKDYKLDENISRQKFNDYVIFGLATKKGSDPIITNHIIFSLGSENFNHDGKLAQLFATSSKDSGIKDILSKVRHLLVLQMNGISINCKNRNKK